MTDTVSSIKFAGEEAPLLDVSAIEEDDLLTPEELNQFLQGSLNLPDDTERVVYSTKDGSYYPVGDVTDDGAFEASGVVPVEEANEEFNI